MMMLLLIGGLLIGVAIYLVAEAATWAFGLAIVPIAAILRTPIAGICGLLFPDAYLTMRVRSRREAVRAQLPDALDLLAVSVEAGLGLDGALLKLAENMKGPLID